MGAKTVEDDVPSYRLTWEIVQKELALIFPEHEEAFKVEVSHQAPVATFSNAISAQSRHFQVRGATRIDKGLSFRQGKPASAAH